MKKMAESERIAFAEDVQNRALDVYLEHGEEEAVAYVRQRLVEVGGDVGRFNEVRPAFGMMCRAYKSMSPDERVIAKARANLANLSRPKSSASTMN